MPSPARAILLLVLFSIPLIEIVLLIKVGQAIGFWWTMLIVVGTAVGGTVLLRRQGVDMLRRVAAAASSGQPPVGPVLDGVLIAIAAVLLITPGLVADTLGLLLLVPPVRKLAVGGLLSRVLTSGSWVWTTTEEDEPRTGPRRPPGASSRPEPDITYDQDGIIIEGEYERLEERTVDPKRNSNRPRG